MKNLIFALLVSVSMVNAGFAADNGCDAKAAEKKLAGAAKNSFLKKCNREAAAGTCDAQAAEKKIYGAAKNSFVKKCLKDAGAS